MIFFYIYIFIYAVRNGDFCIKSLTMIQSESSACSGHNGQHWLYDTKGWVAAVTPGTITMPYAKLQSCGILAGRFKVQGD
jgi:hypothetical protein